MKQPAKIRGLFCNSLQVKRLLGGSCFGCGNRFSRFGGCGFRSFGGFFAFTARFTFGLAALAFCFAAFFGAGAFAFALAIFAFAFAPAALGSGTGAFLGSGVSFLGGVSTAGCHKGGDGEDGKKFFHREEMI
jgi:hypothetical protein